MSCYEWEAGTIKLSAVEFPRVYNDVLATAQGVRDRVFDHTQNFWKEIPAKAKRDPWLYGEWAHAYAFGRGTSDYESETWRDGHRVAHPVPPRKGAYSYDDHNGEGSDLLQALMSVLRTKIQPEGKPWPEWVDSPPRRVLQSDLPRPTKATLKFQCGESYMSFDRTKRTVHWEVPENNHARDRGRRHPVAQALFKAFDGVTRRGGWTRGTGGTIVGNDEYSRDSRDVGGGGNYVLDEWNSKTKLDPTYDRWGYRPYSRSW